jgi:hydroxymethylbilane synthase
VEPSRPIVIGTRGSTLALAQTALVANALQARHPGVAVHVERISTVGDRVQDRPLHQIGGKAVFVTEIERALRDGRIDLAVHSAKDLPSVLPADMRVIACLPRADARDALVSRSGLGLDALPAGSVVATSSPRRACQLRARRPDLVLHDVRGNVDTRLARLDAGAFDAIVLAVAGLTRLGLAARITERIPLDVMPPCAAQGAIAIEVAAANARVAAIARPLDDAATMTAVVAERAFLALVGGSCTTPLAAHAIVDGDVVRMTAMIGAADGRMVAGDATGPRADAAAIGRRLAADLLARGGAALLAELTNETPDVLVADA